MARNAQSDPFRNCPSNASALDQNTQFRAIYWQRAPASETDPMLRATNYLSVLRDLSVDPSWISLAHIADPPGEALRWMGQHIHRANQRLHSILSDLLDCFEAALRPSVQIFAAPIAPQAGVDGFCCDIPDLAFRGDSSEGTLRECPSAITLMVDPGRIVPADWPGLVAHELAHSIARVPGHGAEFRRAIAHLCLAQDLPLPPPQLDAEALSSWPPCRHNPQPELFWLGKLPF